MGCLVVNHQHRLDLGLGDIIFLYILKKTEDENPYFLSWLERYKGWEIDNSEVIIEWEFGVPNQTKLWDVFGSFDQILFVVSISPFSILIIQFLCLPSTKTCLWIMSLVQVGHAMVSLSKYPSKSIHLNTPQPMILSISYGVHTYLESFLEK